MILSRGMLSLIRVYGMIATTTEISVITCEIQYNNMKFWIVADGDDFGRYVIVPIRDHE